MDTLKDPLLPAFYMLWKAAMSEPLKTTDQDNANANTGHVNGNNNNNPPVKPTQTRHSETNQQLIESLRMPRSDHIQRKMSSDETVVVCTLELDQGNKFVKQIIHEGTQRTVWSSVEDLFVDWLNSELTSQHAERVDLTIYLCRLPMSTTSEGIRLWMENLRCEGKEVNIRIRVASLAPLLPESKDLTQDNVSKRKTSIQETEAEDTVRSLKHLINKGAEVEPISTGDWMQLITLLTDRSSLQALDLKRSPCSGILSTMLQSSP